MEDHLKALSAAGFLVDFEVRGWRGGRGEREGEGSIFCLGHTLGGTFLKNSNLEGVRFLLSFFL